MAKVHEMVIIEQEKKQLPICLLTLEVGLFVGIRVGKGLGGDVGCSIWMYRKDMN